MSDHVKLISTIQLNPGGGLATVATRKKILENFDNFFNSHGGNELRTDFCELKTGIRHIWSPFHQNFQNL